MRILILLPLLLLAGCKLQVENTSKDESQNDFQLIQLGEFRRDQFLLNKKTGQIWRSVCAVSDTKNPTDCAYNAWIKADVEDINIKKSEIYAWADHLEEKKNKKQ